MVLEKELKVLLTKEQFEGLQAKINIEKHVSQINFYYSDDEGKILQNGCTIRVRGKVDSLKLEIKIPVGNQGLIHVKNEYEESIEGVPYKISGRELFHISGVQLPDVTMKGFLITERFICQWDEYTKVCLDRNSYLGIEDFELEIEYTGDSISKELFQVIKGMDIELRETIGKCKRFLGKKMQEYRYTTSL